MSHHSLDLDKRAEAKPKQIKVNIGGGPVLEGNKGPGGLIQMRFAEFQKRRLRDKL